MNACAGDYKRVSKPGRLLPSLLAQKKLPQHAPVEVVAHHCFTIACAADQKLKILISGHAPLSGQAEVNPELPSPVFWKSKSFSL